MKINLKLNDRRTFTYSAYREYIDGLLSENKTTGENQTDALVEFTKMNVHRMKRWDKMAKISSELSNNLEHSLPQTWIVLAEAWCGDAAQSLPWINKMAVAGNIELLILLRDENLDLMDAYLTNGGRSIPKLISFSETNEELFNWGPRPQEVKLIVDKLKSEGLEHDDIIMNVHAWYAKDKGKSISEEFTKLLTLEEAIA
jgi:hypothetical protein